MKIAFLISAGRFPSEILQQEKSRDQFSMPLQPLVVSCAEVCGGCALESGTMPPAPCCRGLAGVGGFEMSVSNPGHWTTMGRQVSRVVLARDGTSRVRGGRRTGDRVPARAFRNVRRASFSFPASGKCETLHRRPATLKCGAARRTSAMAGEGPAMTAERLENSVCCLSACSQTAYLAESSRR
jgi:hypothetical protein